MRIQIPTFTKQSKVIIQSLIFVGLLLILILSCKKEDPPTLTTLPVTEITGNTAKSGGNISDDGGATVTAKGVCWNTTQNPTINDNSTIDGTGPGIFESCLTNLLPNTTYYVRAYATNGKGTGYGQQERFTTTTNGDDDGTVTDIEGNVYQTVVIGLQEWLVQNLKTTKYRNGDDIRTELNDSEWESSTDGAYAIYPHESITGLNSDTEVLEAYGALYNWYAVNDSRRLCPTGWRVPTEDDWTQLVDYVESKSNALKSCRQVSSPLGGDCTTSKHPRWDSHTNHFGTNTFGFSALPGGGQAHPKGTFTGVGLAGYFWTNAEHNATYAWSRFIYYGNGDVLRSWGEKKYGKSVRCIKD